MITWSRRRFPIAPLATIVADPLWPQLSKKEQQELRMLHAKKLKSQRRERRSRV
jgi:hypothetical protein